MKAPRLEEHQDRLACFPVLAPAKALGAGSSGVVRGGVRMMTLDSLEERRERRGGGGGIKTGFWLVGDTGTGWSVHGTIDSKKKNWNVEQIKDRKAVNVQQIDWLTRGARAPAEAQSIEPTLKNLMERLWASLGRSYFCGRRRRSVPVPTKLVPIKYKPASMRPLATITFPN
jgi:hypothetical protein